MTGLFNFPLSAGPENTNCLDSRQNLLVLVSWKLCSHETASFIQGTRVVIFPTPFNSPRPYLLSQLRPKAPLLKGLSPDPVPPAPQPWVGIHSSFLHYRDISFLLLNLTVYLKLFSYYIQSNISMSLEEVWLCDFYLPQYLELKRGRFVKNWTETCSLSEDRSFSMFFLKSNFFITKKRGKKWKEGKKEKILYKLRQPVTSCLNCDAG